MATELAIGNILEIPPGEGRNFEVRGMRVAVFHKRSGEIHATQADCPHRGGPLADGLTDENTVVCPLHDRIYDFRTGAGLGNDCTIATYQVRLDDNGTILLSL